MRVEVVVYAALLLLLLSLMARLPVASLSSQVVRSCADLVTASSVHGVQMEIPCGLSENKIVYRGSVVEVPVSYGVVVRGEHWASP